MRLPFTVYSLLLPAYLLLPTPPNHAAELYVFSRDGKTAASSPRELPSVGQPLSDTRTVVVLHAADPAARAACGWYLYVGDTNAAPAGMTLSNRCVEITGHAAVERVTWKPLSPENFQISKYKLLTNLNANDALPAFAAYLDADPVRRMLWDAALTLDSTNAMVRAACDAMSHTIGAETVTNIILSSRAQ